MRKKQLIAFSQERLPGDPQNKKSSRICDMQETPTILSVNHCKEEEKASKILQLVDSPIHKVEFMKN